MSDSVHAANREGLTNDDTAFARRLTDKVEKLGDISAELNVMPVSERAAVAHQMQILNQSDRITNPQLPALELTFEREFKQDGYRGLLQIYPNNVQSGKEHLTSIDALTDPNAWIFKGYHPVYRWPEQAEKSRPTPAYEDGGLLRRNRPYEVDNQLSDQLIHRPSDK